MSTLSIPLPLPQRSPLPPVAISQDIKQGLTEMSSAIAEEALAGRLQSKDSFNWIRSDSIWDTIVPTHGNFAGPGYSCGDRAEHTREKIIKSPVSQVVDPRTGKWRADEIDKIAKQHDLAYKDAEGQPDYWERIQKADQKLTDDTKNVLEQDRLGNIALTDGERNYGKAKGYVSCRGLTPLTREKTKKLRQWYG